MPWLNDCLNALAGLPAEHVLRFGHLVRVGYHEQRLMASPRDVAAGEMSKDPDLRLVNLGLMATDVTGAAIPASTRIHRG